MNWPKIQRTPALVLAVAQLIALASMCAFYTSEGAAKARKRVTRLEDALASGIRTLGPTLDFDPGASVQPGTSIAEILDLSQIELIVLVGDRQIDALRPGMLAQVLFDVGPGSKDVGRQA